MTELIVALDGPDPWKTFWFLRDEILWYKLGPQAIVSYNFTRLIQESERVKIFLDLKLVDTKHTVREAVRRFAYAGIAAVSTSGLDATKAALEGAEGTPIKVWQWLWPTDRDPPTEHDPKPTVPYGLHGVICPWYAARGAYGGDVIVPGVRMSYASPHDGHCGVGAASTMPENGVTHAVVGRPIWQAADPVAAAREFMEALR